MKKILLSIMILIFPINVFAKTYEIKDAKITIDNNEWDVFYFDEPFDSELLEKYGLDEDSMKKIFVDYNGFLYAINIDKEDFSLGINSSSREVDMDIVNLDLLAEAFAYTYYDGNYEIYENNYKFAKFASYDSENYLYRIGYAILVNSTAYLFDFSKSTKITDEERLEIEKIIDSIEFNDLYYNKVHDGNTNIQSDKTKINWSNIIIASVSSGIGAVVMNLVLKKFKK